MKTLNKTSLPAIAASGLTKPNYLQSQYPEKILQFGTGVLLKGLPDYIIDSANNQGQFCGQILVAKSTPGQSEVEAMNQQDCLFTLHSQGIKDGKTVETSQIIGAISRMVHADTQWTELVKAVQSEHLEIIISNTTEIGLNSPDASDFLLEVPRSFVGKLLKLLSARYSDSTSKGLIIIPTELVVDNGQILKKALVKLALENKLDRSFIEWLQNANTFCNSLVDRIVTGKPNENDRVNLEQKLGYSDPQMIFSESYSLWAIEADEKTKVKLSFANESLGCIVTNNIEQYRELKLRLLNASHSLMVGYAIARGHHTVFEATQDPELLAYLQAAQAEIIDAMDIPKNISEPYAAEVLARFQNPAIEHKLLGITAQYSSKIKARVVPLLLNFQQKHCKTPEAIWQGIEYFLQFMQINKVENGQYFGYQNGEYYQINDINVAEFYQKTKKQILENTKLWGSTLV